MNFFGTSTSPDFPNGVTVFSKRVPTQTLKMIFPFDIHSNFHFITIRTWGGIIILERYKGFKVTIDSFLDEYRNKFSLPMTVVWKGDGSI